jgi:hypothetical protein
VDRRVLQARPRYDPDRQALRNVTRGRRVRDTRDPQADARDPDALRDESVLVGTPEEYIKALGKTATEVHNMKPGDKLEL